MADIRIEDYSAQVKAVINAATIAWLYEVSEEVKSQAQRNCNWPTDDDSGKQLKGSYAAQVDADKGEARVGSPLEQAYWEEWGTGEYAAHGDGRRGWWVFIKGQQSSPGGGKSYDNEDDAKAAAAFLRSRGLEAYHTNGRRPSYTLEKAFKTTAPRARAAFEQILNDKIGGGGR